MIVERTIEGRTEYLTVADDWLHPARQGKGVNARRKMAEAPSILEQPIKPDDLAQESKP